VWWSGWCDANDEPLPPKHYALQIILDKFLYLLVGYVVYFTFGIDGEKKNASLSDFYKRQNSAPPDLPLFLEAIAKRIL
jgi:hypothetical protein